MGCVDRGDPHPGHNQARQVCSASRDRSDRDPSAERDDAQCQLVVLPLRLVGPLSTVLVTESW